MALVGFASGGLYLAVYVAQWAIFRNGMRAEVAGTIFRGEPAGVPNLLFQGAGYYAATVALFALYAWILILCRRGQLRDPRARLLALAFPVLFNVGLLLGQPYQSIDALTYVAHGFMGNLPGANPYVTAASGIEGLDFARELAAFGWLPVHGVSPYGPLWTWIEVAAFWVAGSVGGTFLLIKAIVVGASLGTAALIWHVLGRVRPEDQLLGTLLYLWNPMIVIEFAAEGHNDALMILCLLASLALTVSGRPARAVTASFLGVLVKYLPLLFLPAQAVYLWRTEGNQARLALRLGLGVLAGVALTTAFYAPFWAGIDTLEGVRLQGRPFLSPSPSGVLYWLLGSAGVPGTAQVVLLLISCAFVSFLVAMCWRVRDAATLLSSCAGIGLFYVLVVSTVYWPWYAAMPLALMALSPRGLLLPAAFVLTLCSRLVAPISTLFTNDFLNVGVAMTLKVGIGVTVPFVVILAMMLRRRLAGPTKG